MTPRPQRGYSVETGRGDAAAVTWIFRGASRQRRGNEPDRPRRARRNRRYLAKTLHCDPMRLTKKFKGDKSLTKCGFKPCKQTPELLEEAQCVRAALADQERRLASSQGRR